MEFKLTKHPHLKAHNVAEMAIGPGVHTYDPYHTQRTLEYSARRASIYRRQAIEWTDKYHTTLFLHPLSTLFYHTRSVFYIP